MSKSFLKDDDFKRKSGVKAIIRKTEDNSMTASQHDGKPVKATYYIRPDLVKGLKELRYKTDRDFSDLVNEAIEDLLNKLNVQ
jgi:hypothetical protein